MIEINELEVVIYDTDGVEIVKWVEDEWVEDPSVTVSIANAINIFYTDGVEFLKSILKE